MRSLPEVTTAKEPMVPTVLPDRPWQMLGVDLLDFNGQQYMVAVDYYSRYMAQAHETGTSQVGGPKLAKVFYGRIV